MQQNQEMITIKGTVERITFTNTSNAFTVLELDVAGDDTITVVGELYGVAVGEELKLTGNYTSHPRFGYQFKAELCERTLPSEANAILKYLSGGAIKGIGPITARRLVEKFGDDTLKIIETEPQQLCYVKGITLKSAMKISEEFKKIFGIRKVIAYLSKFNVTAIQAIAVWKKFGADAIELIEENPYLLCSDDIGVSFFDLDAITEDMNIPRESEYRIRAGIMFVMDYNFNGGHTCLPFASLLSKSCELLNLANDVVEIELEAMLSCEYLVEYSNDKNRYVYLPHTYLAERYVSEKLKIMMQNFSSDEYDADKSIDKIEKNMGITFEAMQRTAIKTALNSSVMILTGGPGTGKTTTLRGIIECLKQNGEKVAVAAPTGRAAKRISELTGEDAKTIHRLLEVDFTSESAHISFKRNERNLLDADAVIIDELSMVDIMLFEGLVRALKLSCRLILVGDYNQLPSVGAGNVLKDLIKSGRIITVELTEIFRQASQSLIVTNAHDIISGEMPILDNVKNDFFFIGSGDSINTAEKVVELCKTRLPKTYGYSPFSDIQVIAPSKKGESGTIELNQRLQKHINPKSKDKKEVRFGTFVFREGDKVMQIKNNYDMVFRRENGEDGAGIYNGDIGIIEKVNNVGGYLTIRFDDKITDYSFDFLPDLELAYAITVHKSQGSEYDAVIIPLMNNKGPLYYRNLLYTAVTRAKKILIIVGSKHTVAYMVNTATKNSRFSNLANFLQE